MVSGRLAKFVPLTSMTRRLKLVWWIVKLFAIIYGALFFRSDHVVLPTIWGCRFIIPKKGFSKYLLLNIMIGLYELEWQSHFDSYVRSAKLFIDVGAAADGYHSLRAFRKNKHIKSIAIEPLQLEFKYLVKNVLMNQALGRGILLKLALGEGRGEALMGGEKVPMLSLDDLVEELKLPRVDIIKIDVEGAGLSVIKGALKTISKDKPIIFFEVHDELEGQALEVLRALGYDLVTRDGRTIAIPQTRVKELRGVSRRDGKKFLENVE
ncbi:MAG: FkbM family methyltransferase [Candidatus Nezhaarchaeales archaeon]